MALFQQTGCPPVNTRAQHGTTSMVNWQTPVPDGWALLLHIILCLAPFPLSQVRRAAGTSLGSAPPGARGCACAYGTPGVGCRVVEMLDDTGLSACCRHSRVLPSAGPPHGLTQLQMPPFMACCVMWSALCLPMRSCPFSLEEGRLERAAHEQGLNSSENSVDQDICTPPAAVRIVDDGRRSMASSRAAKAASASEACPMRARLLCCPLLDACPAAPLGCPASRDV